MSVREDGYAVDGEEPDENLCSVALAVSGADP